MGGGEEAGLKRFEGREPEEIGQLEIREYFNRARDSERGASWLKVQMAGVRFLFATTLGHPEAVAWMRWPRQREPLPVVLSGQEILKLLAAVSSPVHRTIALVMYGAGLRVTEACALEVGDIDRERSLLRVRHGKGGRPRHTMLGARVYRALRGYWAAHRPPEPLLFPGPDARKPIDPRYVRAAIAEAAMRVELVTRRRSGEPS